MWQSVRALVLPAVQSRLLLVINHVLSREPVATQRLRPHAGRRLRVEAAGLPALLPPLPPLVVAVTPAGLFEGVDAADAADLTLRVQAPAPAQWLAALAGEARPQVQIEGDAALAGDMHWLVDNLRWDVEADLAEALGPAVAHQVVQVGRGAAAALRRGMPAGESAPR
jgi:ubiquinone biosynthesis accessory factor UbiJ